MTTAKEYFGDFFSPPSLPDSGGSDLSKLPDETLDLTADDPNEDIRNVRERARRAHKDLTLRKKLVDRVSQQGKTGLEAKAPKSFKEGWDLFYDMEAEGIKSTWSDWDDLSTLGKIGMAIPKAAKTALWDAPNILFTAPSAAANIALGYDKPTFAESATQAEAARISAPPGSWEEMAKLTGASVVGGAADIFLNPLNLLSMGAKPLRTAAERLQRASTSMAGVTDLERTEKLAEMVRHQWSEADITAKALREDIGPRYIQEQLSGHQKQAEQYAKEVEDAQEAARKEYAAAHATDPNAAPFQWDNAAWWKSKGHPENADYTHAELLNQIYGEGALKNTPQGIIPYERMLRDAEAELKANPREFKQKWSKLPKDIAGDTTKTAQERAQAVANHQVYFEHEALAGAAKVRLGIPSAEITTPIPSPFELLKKGASKLFWGKRQLETPGMSLEALEAHVGAPAGTAQDAIDFLKAHFPDMPLNVQDVSTIDMEKLLRATQVGTYGSEGGEAGSYTARKLLHEEAEIKNYVHRTLADLAPADRIDHLDKMINTYKFVRDGMAAEKQAGLYATRLKDVDEALKHLVKMRTDPRALAKITGLDQLQAPAASDLFASIRQRMTTAAGILQEARQGIDAARVGTAPANVAQVTAHAIEASHNAALESLLTGIFQDFTNLTEAQVPYRFGLQHRQNILNMGQELTRMREDMSQIIGATDKYFLSNRTPVTGVEILGKSLTEKPGLWQHLAENVGVEAHPRPLDAAGLPRPLSTAGTINPRQVNEATGLSLNELGYAHDRIEKEVQRLVTAGKFTAQDAANVRQFVSGLDEHSMGEFLYSMRYLATEKAHLVTRGRLDNLVSAPFRTKLEHAETLLQGVHQNSVNAILEDFARYQAKLTPELFGKWAYPTLIKQIDNLHDAVFKAVGITPAISEILHAGEVAQSKAHEDSLRLGIEHNGEIFEKGLQEVDNRLTSANLGPHRMSQVLEDANNGYGKILQSRNSLPGVFKAVSDPEWEDLVHAAAQKIHGEGEALLARAFGGEISDPAIQAKIQAFIAHIDPLVEKAGQDIVETERPKGMIGFTHADYLPKKAIGRDARDYNKLTSGAQYIEKTDTGTMEGRFFKQGEHRVYADTAQSKAALDKLNLERANRGEPPLDVDWIYHTSALLAERKFQSLRTQAARETIDRLRSVLPEFAIFNRKGNVADMGKEGFHALEDLIPSMRGYWVKDPMYRYIKDFTPAAQREETLVDTIIRANKWMARANVSFSLGHLKNMIGLAMVADVPLDKIVKNLRYALSGENKVRGELEGTYAPRRQYRNAIESHPDYQLAIQNGLTHFRGLDQLRSVSDNVIDHLRPTSLASVWSHIKQGEGMFSGFLFDVIDRSVKLAMFQHGLEKGLTPQAAASLTNYYMIDYAAKAFNPSARRIGYSMMPFFAWTAGNAMLHFPNILKNPRNYALTQTIMNWWNSQYSPYAGMPTEKIPSALQMAFAVPSLDQMAWGLRGTELGQNNEQTWLFPELPWGSHLRALQEAAKNPFNLQHLMATTARFAGGKSYLSDLLYDAYNVTRKKAEEGATISDVLFGTDNQPGVIAKQTWGFAPYKGLAEAGRDAWSELVDVMDKPEPWSADHHILKTLAEEVMKGSPRAALLLSDMLGVRAAPVDPKGKRQEIDPVREVMQTLEEKTGGMYK